MNGLSAVNFSKLLASDPINRQAWLVTLQAGCDDGSRPLTKCELVALCDRLRRKQRLLKKVLRIETKAQHANAVTRFRKNIRQARDLIGRRALSEYVSLGDQIFMIQNELAEMRKARQYAYAAELVYKVAAQTSNTGRAD